MIHSYTQLVVDSRKIFPLKMKTAIFRIGPYDTKQVKKKERVQNLHESSLQTSAQHIDYVEMIKQLSPNIVAFISCRSRLYKVSAGSARGQTGSKVGGGQMRLLDVDTRRLSGLKYKLTCHFKLAVDKESDRCRTLPFFFNLLFCHFTFPSFPFILSENDFKNKFTTIFNKLICLILITYRNFYSGRRILSTGDFCILAVIGTPLYILPQFSLQL